MALMTTVRLVTELQFVVLVLENFPIAVPHSTNILQFTIEIV